MKRKAARAYVDGFGAVRSVLQLDALTANEIFEALDPEREDPLLNPWKRGYTGLATMLVRRSRMKGLVALALAVLIFMTTAAQAADPTVERGKAVYEAATPKCKTCHSVGGVGNAKGALEGAAGKLKPEEVKAWLRTPKEMTEKTKSTRRPLMPTYGPDKISDADLDALTAYLLSLK